MRRLFFLNRLETTLLELSKCPKKAFTTILTVRERDQNRFEYRLAGFPGRPGLLYFESMDFEAPAEKRLPEGAELISFFSYCHYYQSVTVEAAMQYFERKSLSATYDMCSARVEHIDLMFTYVSHETRGFFVM